jgi:hypothetical protein
MMPQFVLPRGIDTRCTLGEVDAVSFVSATESVSLVEGASNGVSGAEEESSDCCGIGSEGEMAKVLHPMSITP